jgi:hypothetical protein
VNFREITGSITGSCKETYVFAKSYWQTARPIQPFVKLVLSGHDPGGRQPNTEEWHITPYRVKVKKEWRYNAKSSIRLHVTSMDTHSIFNNFSWPSHLHIGFTRVFFTSDLTVSSFVYFHANHSHIYVILVSMKVVYSVFIVYSVFCIVLWHCTTPCIVFLLCIVLFIFLVFYCACLWCTCCYPNWGLSVLFPQF